MRGTSPGTFASIQFNRVDIQRPAHPARIVEPFNPSPPFGQETLQLIALARLDQ